MERIPAGTVSQPADNNAVWSQSTGLLPRRRCWFMMQDQDVSASDALVMCRLFFWHLEMLTTHHVSAGGFWNVYFLAHAATWRWSARVTFSSFRGSTGSTPSIIAADLWRVRTVSPSYTLLLGPEDANPDAFLMEADQVWQVGSFRDGGGGCWKDVGRAAPVFSSVSPFAGAETDLISTLSSRSQCWARLNMWDLMWAAPETSVLFGPGHRFCS